MNLSDVAAMGGDAAARAALARAAGRRCRRDVDGLLDGFLELAADARVTLAGGNITRSPGPLIVDVTRRRQRAGRGRS